MFCSPEPDVNLCDDGESFPTLESGLWEVFDHPLTTLPPITLFSPNTLRDNTASLLTFPDSPYPLTQSMGFGVGEIFSIDVSVDEDDFYYGLDNIAIEKHDPNETLVGRSSVDIVFTVLPSLDHDDHVSPDPLAICHVSPSCSLLSHSPECYNWLLVDSHVVLEGNKVECFETQGTFRGCNPSLNPYNLYLEHLSGKIRLIIAFNYSTDFSKGFDKF